MLRFFRPQLRALSAAALVSTATTLANIALLGTSAFLIARAAQMPPVLHLTVAVVTVRALALTRSVGRYTERLISHDATFRSLADMRSAVYRKVEQLAPTGLADISRGDLVWRLVADVDRMQDLPLRVVLPAVAGVVSAVLTGLVATALLPAAGAILVGCLLLAGTLAPVVAIVAAARTQRSVAPGTARLADEVLEFLDGQADLAMLGATADALRRLGEADQMLRHAGSRQALATGAAQTVLVLAGSAATAASVWVAAQAAASGRIGPVLTVVVGLLPLAAFETVASLPAAALAWLALRPSQQRLEHLLARASKAEPVDSVALPPGPHDLALEEVSAGWGGDNVIAGLDLALAAGSHTALMGGSGSGKSTVLAVLAGLLRPTAGRYRIGEVDSAAVPGPQIREHVTLSLQDAHVFHTSIAENLRLAARPGHDPDDDRLRTALHRVGLADWLAEQPEGLATVIPANGATMSGGQRQRLLAARMVIAAPEVWLLDEPTEHLDAAAARQLLDRLLTEAGSSTVVVATHRGDEAARLDQTVCLD